MCADVSALLAVVTEQTASCSNKYTDHLGSQRYLWAGQSGQAECLQEALKGWMCDVTKWLLWCTLLRRAGSSLGRCMPVCRHRPNTDTSKNQALVGLNVTIDIL